MTAGDKKASEESKQGIDWHCWAISLYTAPSYFETYHESIGENCDHASMKAEMTSAITEGASDDWFD